MDKRWTGWGLAAAVALGGAAADLHGTPPEAAEPRTEVVLSKTYTVDRKYRSMKGPFSQQQLYLGDREQRELVWIVGYKAVMVGEDGVSPQRQEFMCHSNLDLNVGTHRMRFRTTPSFSSRLFTLSQGQQTIRFPPGFGIPVRSDEPLSLTTQVLNLNLEGERFDVRHKVTVEYVRQRDLTAPMKPLFPIGAYGLELLEGDAGYFGVRQPLEEKHGPGCLPGDNASSHEYKDRLGRRFTGHWVVKPGREVNRTLVTHLMQVPYDTTIHYIAVHLHPFAESLELRDLTDGRTIFKSRAENFDDRIGLRRVESLSSVEGIPVYADHDYELISTYNNTTDEDQDSMAVMYIYLRDLEVEKRLAEVGWKAPADG